MGISYLTKVEIGNIPLYVIKRLNHILELFYNENVVHKIRLTNSWNWVSYRRRWASVETQDEKVKFNEQLLKVQLKPLIWMREGEVMS